MCHCGRYTNLHTITSPPSLSHSIECVAEGWPRPLVGWKRTDSRRPMDSRFVQHAASLEIRNVRRSDQGSYLCEVANARGSLSAATIVRVIGEDG